MHRSKSAVLRGKSERKSKDELNTLQTDVSYSDTARTGKPNSNPTHSRVHLSPSRFVTLILLNGRPSYRSFLNERKRAAVFLPILNLPSSRTESRLADSLPAALLQPSANRTDTDHVQLSAPATGITTPNRNPRGTSFCVRKYFTPIDIREFGLLLLLFSSLVNASKRGSSVEST